MENDKAELFKIRIDLKELRDYVLEMETTGTTEWEKVKPIIMESLDKLEKRIEELERLVPSE